MLSNSSTGLGTYSVPLLIRCTLVRCRRKQRGCYTAREEGGSAAGGVPLLDPWHACVLSCQSMPSC